MSNSENSGRELHSPNPLRRLYDAYAAGVAYISVTTSKGNEGIGSCFHIGDGIFITARHVVENCTIREIGTTIFQRRYFETEETATTGAVSVDIAFTESNTTNFSGPYFHPDKNIDVAALVIPDIKAPILPLGDHLDDWLGTDYILSSAVVFGYPPIPFSRGPELFVAKCEINAIVDKYTGGHPHFILSSMARGGFSGGPAIAEDGVVLGVITESLLNQSQPPELGYFSVLSVEAIYTCISHHRIVPSNIDKQWDGFWNTESTTYTENYSPSSDHHADVSIYRGKNRYYFTLYGHKGELFKNAIEIIDRQFNSFYSLTWVHDELIKIEFKEDSITEEKANHIYNSLNEMISRMGYKKGFSAINDVAPFE